MDVNKPGKLYVSDFLENLLRAGAEREMVRELTVSSFAAMPAEVRETARYYGGKCMAYPCVWFARLGCGLTPAQSEAIVARSKASIFLSLSTSIADDWLDNDEQVSVAQVSLLYLLLIDGLRHEGSKLAGNAVIFERLSQVIAAMLAAGQPGQHLARTRFDTAGDIARLAGAKIGNFHELIASEFAAHANVAGNHASALARMANRFGKWCALIDDIIDVDIDLAEGDWASRPAIAALKQRFAGAPPLGMTWREAAGQATTPLSLRIALAQQAGRELKTIAGDAEATGMTMLARELGRVADALPQRLSETLLSGRVRVSA